MDIKAKEGGSLDPVKSVCWMCKERLKYETVWNDKHIVGFIVTGGGKYYNHR